MVSKDIDPKKRIKKKKAKVMDSKEVDALIKRAQEEPAFNDLVVALSQFLKAPIPQEEKRDMLKLALIIAGFDLMMFDKEMSKYQ